MKKRMTIAELEKRVFARQFEALKLDKLTSDETGYMEVPHKPVGNLYRQELEKSCEEVMRLLPKGKAPKKIKRRNSFSRWYDPDQPSPDELQKIEIVAKENKI